MAILRVAGLDKWQHYKRRNPPWIKLYNSIFNDYKFSIMDDCQKFHLIALWSLASTMDNKLPNDPEWIAGRIGAKGIIDIGAFVECGFIEIIGDPDDKPKKQITKPKAKPKANQQVIIPSDINLCAWNEWCEYRVEKRKKVTPAAAKKQFTMLSQYDPATQQAIIDNSIQNDYQGLFAPKPGRQSTSTKHTTLADDLTDTSWAH